SVVHQDFTSMEVLCIDDGSTDSSGCILEEYARKYPFIKVFHTANHGTGAARNYGLRRAQGEYIYFIDSDDMLKENALSYLLREMSFYNLDILYFDGEAFYEQKEMSTQYPQYMTTYTYTRSHEYSDVMDGQEMYCRMKKNNEQRVVSTLQILRTAFLRNNGITYPENLLYEDNIFDFDCFSRAKRVSHRKRVCYRRRIRPQSIMTSQTTEFHVYSAFRCYLELAQRVSSLPLRAETSELAKRQLTHFRTDAARKFQLLNTSLDNCTEYFTPAMRALFESMILGKN
ncbi:MAG: glycosyltransferase, partial [Pyramidobacter sp.]|nr:glycosyltransferase [Pyramidobacter sp.]